GDGEATVGLDGGGDAVGAATGVLAHADVISSATSDTRAIPLRGIRTLLIGPRCQRPAVRTLSGGPAGDY
ncbi:MAG: hypothetical protein ABIS84_07130, partial [Arachnia sp.]